MFLLLAAMCFLLFVRFCSAALAPPFLMRTDETHFSYTHNRAYQAASEKQTGFLSRSDLPSARYTRVPERFQPPDCVLKLVQHRTYSTEVTSNPSNLPLHRIIRLCASTRAQLIYQGTCPMSRENSYFCKKILPVFCAGLPKFERAGRLGLPAGLYHYI